jgi:transposase
LISTKALMGLPDYEITGIEESGGWLGISSRYKGPVVCSHCGSSDLRQKNSRIRKLRHESWGVRHSLLSEEALPQRRILADRFHVIRTVNHHFQACWKEIDPVGSKNRELLSLMRRHRHNLNPEQHFRLSAYLAQYPALEVIYRFKQKLCYLLLEKRITQKKALQLAPLLLRMNRRTASRRSCSPGSTG